METKTYIWIGLTLGSIAGGALGSVFDHGNLLGLWGILFSSLGAIAGIWGGYRLGNG